MPVQAERFDDEGFELAGEEIGEEKGGDVVVPAAGEIPVAGKAGKEGITVRAGDALDLFLFAETVETAAETAPFARLDKGSSRAGVCVRPLFRRSD
jgi:hypothetical protein